MEISNNIVMAIIYTIGTLAVVCNFISFVIALIQVAHSFIAWDISFAALAEVAANRYVFAEQVASYLNNFYHEHLCNCSSYNTDPAAGPIVIND